MSERDDLWDCVHEFGEPRVVTSWTGQRVIIADCRKCNTGSMALESAPDMTHHWLMEHLEGVEVWTR